MRWSCGGGGGLSCPLPTGPSLWLLLSSLLLLQSLFRCLGTLPGCGGPDSCHPCPSLAGQRGGALSVPAVERFSLVTGSGEKLHSGASAVTRRPRADTRGRRFNVLQARDPRKGCGRRGGLGNQFSATWWRGPRRESEGLVWKHPFSLSPWIQSGVQGAPRPGSPFPHCKINYRSSCRVFFSPWRVTCRAVRVRKEERSPTEAAPPLTAKEHACRRRSESD